MIRMQYNLKGKSMLEVGGFDSEAKWKKKEGSFASHEPISVLDTRRSPSPSTSTSTLSSSLGGGGVGSASGSTANTASLAAVSGNNLWPPERGPADLSAACGGRKDEWASELQPIPVGLEVSGGERFGLGLEDWESLLSESGYSLSVLFSVLPWMRASQKKALSFNNGVVFVSGSVFFFFEILPQNDVVLGHGRKVL